MAMNSSETIRNGNGVLPAHDIQKKEDPNCRPVDNPTTYIFDEPIEVDTDPSPAEYRVVLVEGQREVVLEVDEDGDVDLEGNSEGYYEEEEHPGYARSVYAMSTYPTVQPAHQVEYPYENGMDAATIDSSRTLYAEDVDYIEEFGRQYCGDYFMPIDETEQTRQYVVHQVYLKLFDLELTTVPLENPHYILDIGTGIGEWAIGMAEKYPRCEVFGTDIAPIQPTSQVPLNIEFHIENAEDEWIRPVDTVDLVHIRNMDGCFSDWSFIYSQAFMCIKPGGWIEVIDWDDYFSDNNYLSFFPEGSAAHILTKASMEAAERAGRPRGVHMNKDLLIQAGFVDIKEQVYDLGIGTRENASYGKFWLFSIVTGIEAYCLRLLTKHLDMDEQYVRSLCDTVSKETKAIADDPDRLKAFAVKLRVMVGRKPLVPGQWTAKGLAENGDINDYSGDESTVGGRSVRTMQGLSDEPTR
ncbi:S-adenosyl-L-methionine-dependent methyltransferase [Apiosordaria backusii]|uniref:S-adenosyl-L-methionine-dependent methyltransferase n=1 Tax=Apiosordaria backusii TaxID=314023 RepID=A0AA40K797_9PEZI|nr:S-adenosyl-L-methionine-dependent methyltransferase [Apiosordaria backusii]